MIDATVRQLVRDRANNRCEYCRLRQVDLPYSTFQIEHIVARKHGGVDDISNLALACNRCNLSKGANLTGIDPETGEITTLFNPRLDLWDAHFSLAGATIVGRTAAGRTTVRVLNMNEARRVRLREVLNLRGHP